MALRRSQWLTAFKLLPLLVSFSTAWMNERPVLEVRDGNLFITSARDKNITLQTLGASNINVNEINLLHVASSAHDASQLVEKWKLGALAEMENTIARLAETVEGRFGLLSRLNNLEFGRNSTPGRFPGRFPRPNAAVDTSARSRIQRLTARVRQAEVQIANLQRKLETNECASNPCQNGGTCVDQIDGYRCRCVGTGWEGRHCDVDINECSRYDGTDLGCQNGATCRNLPGTYQCSCKTGWFGIHCTERSANCSRQSSNELCGHGVCIDKPGSQLGYICICEQGWEPDSPNPSCTKDVDECLSKHPPCSINPTVPCINVPGSFYCGGCPQGYTGNGYYCADIDECAINNGGCSTSPSVQCINTMGSRICGSCPSGYQGNGITCTYVGSCMIRNGGCHPLATCVNSPGMGDWYVQCRCPLGYTGDGMGPNGCVIGTDVSVVTACSSNPCSHGTCIPNGLHDYTCRCQLGYTGRNCDAQINPCDPNPCRNGGTCSVSPARTAVCMCTTSFSGPHCGTQRASCGAVIRDPAGTLQFPSIGSTYPHGLSCAWVLMTNGSRVLNVTFSAFNLEQSTDCQFDFLQVHDGPTAGNHMIGRYCGNRLPKGGNIISSEGALYLWFHSDNNIAADGFTLEWNSIAPLCGGEINADSGRISSPGSPGRYPKNRDCNWHISVSPGKRIQFQFFSMELEEHPTCEKDYLEIRDGPGSNSQQLGLYCNHTNPPPLPTAGDEAWLHFHSDGSGQDSGFQITFSSIEGISGCGGIYTADSGHITSPNYHDNGYETLMDCEWKIQLPRGEKAQITWIDFDLEDSRNCKFDFVEIYDGATREAPLRGRYCGTQIPPNILSESNILLIRFKSDWSFNGKGFRLNYEVWCGGVFTEETGVIQSPYYPNNYPGARTCIYEIVQSPGKGIELTIQDMDIEGWDYPDCDFDHLEVHDGDNENATKIATLCGSNLTIPEFPIMSTHNYMWLKFKTDRTIHQRGFMATYTTVNRGCGGILKERSGIIQPPSENGRYANQEDCTWIIQAPPGYIVQLNWLSFDVEDHDSCRYDYVKISENMTSTSQQDMGTFCGSTKPPIMTSQTRIVTIKFHTDYSRTRDGFMASYIFVDASKVCGGYLSSNSGVIKSPNYPDHYPENRMCEWVINAPVRHQVVLNVQKFDLENQTTCTYDYLEIRNGGLETSPLLGQYCGRNIPRQIKSFGNQIYVKFKSDVSRSGEGFEINWDSSTIGCGGTLSSTSGSITSPNYPQPYNHRAECTWNVRVAAGSVIQFIIVDFDLEEYDYIEFYEGPDTRSKKLGRYAGTKHPLHVQTTANVATVRFRSDWSTAGRGFHINYQALCHNKLNTFRGVIESPNFPNNYPNQENCSWTIEAPRGNRLNLTFSHFDLEEPSADSCRWDYLEIKEGDNDKPTKDIAKLCDSAELPRKIVSTERQVFLKFITDSYTTGNGFRLEWVTNGCGGMLTKPRGTITSPGYPNPYPLDVDCEWHIQVDFMHSIEITLEDVKLEKSPNCVWDKISVFGGEDDTAPKLIEACHIAKPVVLTSTSHNMFIRFHADNSYQNTGFKATYKSVDIRCGGKFTAPTGLIQSPNYPSNYPNDLNCEWLIQVPATHLVNLTFVDFDIEDTANCTDDYVRIYDGPTRDAPVLANHCHNRTPPPYVSTTNELLVVMRTDMVVPAKGFKATYDMTCGARIVTNDQGILSMDAAVGLHTELVNCSWIIVAQNLEDHVTLTMTHMVIGSITLASEECYDSTIQVYEGEGTDGPLLGTWCTTKVPPPITSQGNALTLHVSSLYAPLYSHQFTATYSVLNSACGGNYTSQHGAIATPGYPDSYPRNIECIWNLLVAPGNSLSLSFREFDVIESDNCDLDYVEVREESGAGKLVGVYCGQNINTVSATKSLWVKFKSSASETKKGFIADYNLLPSTSLSGPTGEIASPLYPQASMLEGEFYWRITVEYRSSIQITFKEFHIEQYNDDCYISMVIYDGYDDQAPVLMDKCGMLLPEPVRSSSNMVYIKFTSNPFRLGSWFFLSWLQVPRASPNGGNTVSGSECNEIIALTGSENSSYTFHSPGWPDGYADSLDCNWIFESPPGTHLALDFTKLEVEEVDECNRDYVRVFTGNSLTSQQEWSELGDYCHKNATRENIRASNLMKVNFHTDYSINKTGFQATVRKVCGGQLFGPNGVIEFNDTTTHDTSSRWSAVTCQWNVTVRPGKTIEVKFISLNIRSSTPGFACSDNYLMLKNGGSASSPLLGSGKYCQNEIPDALQTTGNQLYVKMYGDRSATHFKLTYKEVGINCGGQTILSEEMGHAEIKSPNYPNIPAPHSECTWTIMAPAGEQISIDFHDRFDLTSSANCDKEYLEIRDGGTESAVSFGRYCGGTAPSTLRTTGNMMYLHFYTDVNDPKNGFLSHVSFRDNCGGIIRARNGIIESPNYPRPYPINADCTWIIQGPAGHTMKLQFLDIQLPRRLVCSRTDHVLIEDMLPSNNSTTLTTTRRLGQYCGSTNPGVIETASNEAMVWFTSTNTSSPSLKGFRMNFTTSLDSCGGDLIDTGGEFSTPGYPNVKLSQNRYCEWKINAPKGYRIQVDIIDVDLGANRIGMDRRSSPRIAFYNDFTYRSDIKELRANDTQRQFLSTSNTMLIWYWSGTSGQRGFKARYSRVVPALCGGAAMNMEGTLLSNQNPILNMSTFYCSWKADSTSLNLNARTFALTVSGVVGNSSLLVANSPCGSRGTNIVLKGSGNYGVVSCISGTPTDPVTIRSPSPINTITTLKSTWGRYVTNYTINYRWHQCGGILNGPSHTINKPENVTYPLDCVWDAKFPDNGEVILLRFKKLNLRCPGNYIILRNGGPMSPQINKYCGSIIPNNVTSQTNRLWIEYHAEDRNSDFELQLDARQSGCGGIMQGKSSSDISSPGFPSQYPNNAECMWEIEVANGYHIGLVFIDRFNLETSPDCSKDFIQVFDWHENAITGVVSWVDLGKVCGRNTPKPFNSTSNRMRVLFRSNEAISGDGFHARWNENCGGILPVTTETQYLNSPGWPINYRDNLNCNYTFLAPDKNIIVEFTEFNIEGGAVDCRYDNVTIKTSENEYDIPKWCAKDRPPMQRTSSHLELYFRTDSYVTRKGFQLKYYVDECGGSITRPTEIKSPSLDESGNYYSQINCTWRVLAPPGKAVVLRFERFHLEYTPRCFFDYVAVYSDLTTDSNKRLALLCGSLNGTLPVLRSENGSMTINFVTDRSFNYGGFNAKIMFTTGVQEGCGGDIQLSQSQSFRTQSGAMYNALEDCHWKIRAPSNNVVRLTITSFDLKNSPSTTGPAQPCSGDYLEVRDGPGPFSELIGKYCGNVSPAPIISSTNTMWIRLVTDGADNGHGAIGTLDTVPTRCGESILTVGNTTKVLTSPQFPAMYDPGLRCRWTLSHPRRIKRFTIHFVQFDLQDSNNCTGDVLSIADKNARRYISEGFGEDFIFSGNHDYPSHHSFWMAAHSPQRNYLYCGSGIPHDFYSYAGELEIQFKSAQNQTGRHSGFKLEYSESNCNRNFTSAQGRIFHEDTTDCWFTVTTAPGHTISLYFNEFMTYDRTACNTSALQIYDGDFNNATVALLCGSTIPNPIFSTGNKISFHSWSRSSFMYESYDITYTTTDKGRGCGGKLFNYGGTFTSPLYPGAYRNQSECTWDVSVPTGSKIVLEFRVFDLGTSQFCQSDYVEITDLLPNGDTLTPTRYCGEDNPANYFATTGQILVKYHTSLNNGGTGWIIAFRAKRYE